MRFRLRRHPFTLGHICNGTNVEVLDEDGNTCGYLTPEFADRLPSIKKVAFPLARHWKVGERVESVVLGKINPGTVHSIETYLAAHERLVIRFDDGVVRAINPDVMRHMKE